MAFVVGYVVIIGFLKFVSTFSYKAFAIYRIALAVVVALLLICGRAAPDGSRCRRVSVIRRK